jgi:O-antigen/teichoic acid export membrane protein
LNIIRFVTKNNFIKSVFSLSAGTLVSQIIALISLPFLTKFYTPTGFGELALFMATIAILVLPATLKLEQAIMLPERQRASAYLLLSIISGSLIVSLSIYFLLFVFYLIVISGYYSAHIYSWLWATPIAVFLTASSQALRFWLIRQLKYTVIGYTQIISILSGTLITCLIGYFYQVADSSVGLIVGQIFQLAISFIVYALVSSKDCKYKYKLRLRMCLNVVRQYKKLAITLLASHSLAVVYGRIPVVLISALYGNHILGLYSMAERLVSAPGLLIANAIGDVYRERASSEWRNNQRFDNIFKKTFLMLFILAFPIYLLAGLLAPAITVIVLGQEWKEAGDFIVILLIGGFFAFVLTPIDKGAVIVGAHKYMFNWHLLRLILKVILALVVLKWNLGIYTFLYFLVLIRCALYIYDYCVEYKLSKGEIANKSI